MARQQKKRLGDMLLAEHIITEEQLQEGLAAAKEEGKRIGEKLVEKGFCNEESIAKAISRQLDIDIISLKGLEIDENVLALADEKLLRKHSMIPFAFSKNNMNVVKMAMADPLDLPAIDDFSIVTNLQVEPVIAVPREIMMALDKYYGNRETLKAAQEYAGERRAIAAAAAADEVYNEDVNSSPIVKLVKSMIEQAARQRASDIHIEALQNVVRVRFRIDGVLYEKFSYDIELLNAIITRIKIIGGMDIAEKRKPQDGRITAVVDKVEYDIRASILPTVYGEKCVMRLAQKKALTRNKKELGFTEHELKLFDGILKNPNGILLVTGPTGSGKSTTLYTALSELNREEVNIITVEDPVEANIDGINQVQVNVKADLTFASALRSILRQDPDIIMIGEIRDGETAQIAVQASITGHLVVSTLHTNSAAGTLTRLMDMGVESYLLADSMIGVIAQRLVRRLCSNCRRAYTPTEDDLDFLKIKKEELDEDGITLYEPCGCDFCNHTGYISRVGVYEIMPITPAIRTVISKHGTVEDIKEVAEKEGVSTLYDSAKRLVLEGVTSVNEMMRIVYEN